MNPGAGAVGGDDEIESSIAIEITRRDRVSIAGVLIGPANVGGLPGTVVVLEKTFTSLKLVTAMSGRVSPLKSPVTSCTRKFRGSPGTAW